MLLPFVKAFSSEGGNAHVPEVVPIDQLTTRAIDEAAADFEIEEAEWPSATT